MKLKNNSFEVQYNGINLNLNWISFDIVEFTI